LDWIGFVIDAAIWCNAVQWIRLIDQSTYQSQLEAARQQDFEELLVRAAAAAAACCCSVRCHGLTIASRPAFNKKGD
jgi:hypothetical protein